MEITDGTWTSFTSFTSDHTRFLVMLPGYLLSYSLLTPFQIECVMNTMNNTYSTKTCPYCTGLHGELLRLSEKPECDDVAGKGIDATDPIVAYAKSFCQARGRGIEIETKELAKLTDAIGPLKASSVNKLCWASVWGQTTGDPVALAIFGDQS